MTPELRARFEATVKNPDDTFYVPGEEVVYRTGNNKHFPVCAVHVHWDGLIDCIIVNEDMSSQMFELTPEDPLYIEAMARAKA